MLKRAPGQFLSGRTGARGVSVLLAFLAGAFTVSPRAWSWEVHQPLMTYAVQALSPALQAKIAQEDAPALCRKEEERRYLRLAEQIGLNKNAEVLPSLTPGQCAKKGRASQEEILRSAAVDEPDAGMDQNLPDSMDPQNERRFMGGKAGITSQGFRHMYFGGWEFEAPIATFQVPVGAIGQAPRRTQLLAHQAKRMLKDGETLWGTRVLAWAAHFVQDLAQPFHAVQIPNLRMVPWSALLHWPPGEAFENLVKETTRTISNYHFAYEGYVHDRFQSKENPFQSCLKTPMAHATLPPVPEDAKPSELALRTAAASEGIAAEMGSAIIAFFGSRLKDEAYDLPNSKGSLDYAALAADPNLASERETLHQVTCAALANAVVGTRDIIQWAFQP